MATNLWDLGNWTVQDLKDMGATLVGLAALIITPAVTLIAALIQSSRAQKVADKQADIALKVAQLQSERSQEIANKQIENALSIARIQATHPMRERWVIAIRDNVAELIGLGSSFYNEIIYASPPIMAGTEGWKDSIDELSIINQKIRLLLELNNKEQNDLWEAASSVLLTLMADREKVRGFSGKINELVVATKKVLDIEWNRLKNSELDAAYGGGR